MTTFFLVKQGKRVAWMKNSTLSPFDWLDYRLFKFPKKNDDQVLRTTVADDFNHLDWSDTTLIKSNSDSGWLTTQGEFVGCDCFDHDAVAWFYFKQKGDTLEKTGYIRVHSIKENKYYLQRPITSLQECFFNRKGMAYVESSEPY